MEAKTTTRACRLVVTSPAEALVQIEINKDIFGNPSARSSSIPPGAPDTAITLARQMYESRDYGAMPILADALQDAGCEEEAILNHVHGCWVLDLVLGKE